VHICSFCGSWLEVPDGARVHTAPAPDSDAVRVVFADGREIHRCLLDDPVGATAGDRSLGSQHVRGS
jgi:hypothetical protein